MSKANRKFVQADEAVSPVIGVILMVAITVVLAAVVFVLVSNLSNTKDQAPQMTFTKSGSNQTVALTVASAPTPIVQWSAFSWSNATGCAAPTFPTGSVDAGDVITGFTGNCAGASFSITHKDTNSLVYSTTL